jgi:hypothetical protein
LVLRRQTHYIYDIKSWKKAKGKILLLVQFLTVNYVYSTYIYQKRWLICFGVFMSKCANYDLVIFFGAHLVALLQLNRVQLADVCPALVDAPRTQLRQQVVMQAVQEVHRHSLQLLLLLLQLLRVGWIAFCRAGVNVDAD